MDKENMVFLGQNLKILRISAGKTQENIRRDLGYAIPTICRIEKGESNPSFRLIMQLIQLYKYKGDIRKLYKKNGVIHE